MKCGNCGASCGAARAGRSQRHIICHSCGGSVQLGAPPQSGVPEALAALRAAHPDAAAFLDAAEGRELETRGGRSDWGKMKRQYQTIINKHNQRLAAGKTPYANLLDKWDNDHEWRRSMMIDNWGQTLFYGDGETPRDREWLVFLVNEDQRCLDPSLPPGHWNNPRPAQLQDRIAHGHMTIRNLPLAAEQSAAGGPAPFLPPRAERTRSLRDTMVQSSTIPQGRGGTVTDLLAAPQPQASGPQAPWTPSLRGSASGRGTSAEPTQGEREVRWRSAGDDHPDQPPGKSARRDRTPWSWTQQSWTNWESWDARSPYDNDSWAPERRAPGKGKRDSKGSRGKGSRGKGPGAAEQSAATSRPGRPANWRSQNVEEHQGRLVRPSQSGDAQPDAPEQTGPTRRPWTQQGPGV